MAGFTAPRKLLSRFKPKTTRRERREKRSEFTGGDIEVWTRENADHAFTNTALLRQARSHRSWCAEHPGNPSNERLEFLGDAILQWTITDRIYQAHPTMNEGELTDLRKSLVNAETLADIAREIQLGQWIQLGAGELSAGGRKKSSILADALEAFIGALYLDGGPDKARAFVIKIMGDRVMSQADRLDEFDARSHLIRVCVREYSRPPLVEIEQTGAAHEPTFTARVIVNGVEVGCENGRTKKAAAQAASTMALSVLHARGVDIGRA